MKEQHSGRRSLFDRKMQRKFERTIGKRRLHRSMAEKLRKYEVRGEGYEFVPAMMHLVQRYLANLPDEARNDMDRRLAKALNSLPNARAHLQRAITQHQQIPYELKRRVFSPKYLGLNTKQEIDTQEMLNIIQRAKYIQNTNIKYIISVAAETGRLSAQKMGGCCCCCCCQTPPSHPDPQPTAPPNQYEITFTKLYCVDESDPEWGGSDEVYVVFGVITEEMVEAGTAAVTVHTQVYEEVDDGDTRPGSGDQNLRLFGFTGPRAIESSVLISAACFENDLGDPSETAEEMRGVLTTVATTAAGAGGVAGWIVAGVAVIAIGITYLVDLLGADDQINDTIALSLTEADADAKTASVNPFILGPLHFDGGDDDGIYDVYLKLRRV